MGMRVCINYFIYKFVFNYELYLGKANDTQCGGNIRCGKCAGSWGAADRVKLWDYHCMMFDTYRKENFLSNYQLYDANPKVAERYGIKREHPLVKSLPENSLDYKLGCDALHNIGGHERCILDNESTAKEWNDEIFMKNLSKVVNRTSTADLRFADLRLIFVNYKDIILPALSDMNRQNLLGQCIENLLEIQWISYQLPSAQKNRQVRLRLNLNLFIHYLYSRILWGDNIMDVYLHEILIHWGRFFETNSFLNCSTEQGEAWYSSVKRILKAFAPRNQEAAIEEVLICLAREKNVDKLQHNMFNQFQLELLNGTNGVTISGISQNDELR